MTSPGTEPVLRGKKPELRHQLQLHGATALHLGQYVQCPGVCLEVSEANFVEILRKSWVQQTSRLFENK
jgi:hypothetical protein